MTLESTEVSEGVLVGNLGSFLKQTFLKGWSEILQAGKLCGQDRDRHLVTEGGNLGSSCCVPASAASSAFVA